MPNNHIAIKAVIKPTAPNWSSGMIIALCARSSWFNSWMIHNLALKNFPLGSIKLILTTISTGNVV